MTSPYDTYTSPLATRNASPEMLRLWSARHKFNTWRRIWLAVAEAQHELTCQNVGQASRLPADAKGGPGAGAGGTPAPHQPLVTREQVEELRAVVNRGITDDEIKLAEKYERELRHDVMAHVHALGDSCPKAKGIIHLGMTSQDVVCNADAHTLIASLKLIHAKITRVALSFSSVAQQHNTTPCLGFTHYQPAQPTTVGRRVIAWGYDLTLAAERVDYVPIKYRGFRGATGTQAAWIALLSEHDTVDVLEAKALAKVRCDNVMDDTEAAVRRSEYLAHLTKRAEKEGNRGDIKGAQRTTDQAKELERRPLADDIVDAAGIERSLWTYLLTGQTYPRVIDTFILADLASTASVLHKIATDIRLLCNRKEIDEPFEDKQIGSSAMPYKRNPMRCERICGLTRFVMNLVGNAYDTAATQWLERTLDDSSNRRLSLPEAFLALDGALDLMHNVASGLIVHEAMVKKNLMAELPFMATENIMMACVKLGGDRQHYHELIRVHAQAAGHRVKHEGLDNDLLDRLKSDKNFWSKARGGPLSAELDWDGVMDPMKYIGRSVEQTERFIKEVVEPLREQYKDALANLGESGPKV